MPDRFKRRVLMHLKHESYSPSQVEQLAKDLGVPEDQVSEFRTAIEQLAEAGQVVLSDSRHVTLPPIGKEVVGHFKRNPRGFGFIIPRDVNAHGDLFVPPDATMDALSGDIVRAEVRTGPGRGGRGAPREHFGQIVEILERQRSTFAGELRRRGEQWLIYPDGKALTEPVIVKDVTSKSAVEGDKVSFELVRHPEGPMLGEAVIVKVLGESGEPDVETEAVIAAFNLREGFPEACIEQTRGVTAAFDAELKRWESDPSTMELRKDVREEEFILTIDPPDAKDYDDAISIRRLPGGGWLLGIHIADVAHFIDPGSALDVEALERGNSCYLPRRVLPMLPELLSNGICSLQEGVPRCCKSAYIRYDEQGRVSGRGFASTLIRSRKRLTYLEAQAIIDGDLEEAKKRAKTEPKYTDELIAQVREMNILAKRIEGRRRKAGMIHLELPQVELVYDERGRVVDAQPEDDAYTHTLIEMFMVEANEALAKLFEEMQVPLLRRVHPEPVPGAFDDLRDFVRVAGYKIPKSPTREELQALLEATKGTPASYAVHFAVLRTLTKAEYSPDLIGHFALASDAYAHFTSPIRRYPDLTVHRALAAYLSMTENGENPPKSDGDKRKLGAKLREHPFCPEHTALVDVGRRCSRTEVNAAGAEQELRSFLVLQLMAEHVGAEFPGVVTGVTPTGVFVRLHKYLVEGLIKSVDLPTPQGTGGRWRIDPRSGALVEQGSGRSYRMGDTVAVVVASVDLARRQMELLISDAEAKRRIGAGKALKLAQPAGGGIGGAGGGNWDKVRTGADKRAARSKSREKGKSDHRQDRKKKGPKW